MRQLCDERNIPLTVEQVQLSTEGGNLQERARDARYSLAEGLALGDYAAAHTASDQAETILYRLAVSPGSRALHGMAPRRGRLVRPLLGVTREEVREYLRARGLEWREDPSNADRRFARARVRHDVLDALRELSGAAERTIAETSRQLRDEAEVLDAVVVRGDEGSGRRAGDLADRIARAPSGGAPAGASQARRPQPVAPRARRDPRPRRARHEVARPGRRPARRGRVRDASLHAQRRGRGPGTGDAVGAGTGALRRLGAGGALGRTRPT